MFEEAFEMTDMVKKFGIGTQTLQQAAKIRGFHRGEERVPVAVGQILCGLGVPCGGKEIA